MPSSWWLSSLPWLGLGLLGLLNTKRFHQKSAWWILVPAIASFGLVRLYQVAAVDFIPSEPLDMFSGVIYALSIGTAALWLTAGLYPKNHRFVRFLLTALVLLGYGLFVFHSTMGWNDNLEFSLPASLIIFLGAVTLSLALSLAAWICHRTENLARLLFWVLICLLAIPAIIFFPFILIVAVGNGENIPWGEFLIALSLFGGMLFGILLPYLMLSMANGFYRQRLKELIGLGLEVKPSIPLASSVDLTHPVTPGKFTER